MLLCNPMKEVVFWKANDVQVGTEKLPISQDEADYLVKAIFPGKNIHDLCKEFEFSENVHFSGEIRIIPGTAIRFDGYLLDKDEPSYVFDVNLSSSNSQLFGARLERLPESKNIGWGRPIFNKLRNLSEELGLNEFIVHPGLEDGGWYWARLGALPIDRLECESLCDDYLKPRIELYRDHIDPAIYEHVCNLIQGLQDNPSLINQLATLKQKVPTLSGEQSLGRALLRDSKWMARVPLSTNNQEPIVFEHSVSNSEEETQKTTQNPLQEAFPTFRHMWEQIQNFTR